MPSLVLDHRLVWEARPDEGRRGSVQSCVIILDVLCSYRHVVVFEGIGCRSEKVIKKRVFINYCVLWCVLFCVLQAALRVVLPDWLFIVRAASFIAFF
jgi:hypothetical protein